MDTQAHVDCSFDDIAEYYHIEYPETADHAFLRRLVHRAGVGSILEIPSGAGRNLAVLCEGGAAVTAVDLSPAMVAQVRDRIARSGLEAQVTPVVADMCQLRLESEFGLVVVPREAFQLIAAPDDARRALASLALHLRRRGSLLIDIAHFVDDPRAGPGIQPDYYSPGLADGEIVHEWDRRSERGERISRSRAQYHVSTELYRTRFYYAIDKGAETSRMTLELEFRLYSTELLVELAAEAGLRVAELYGDYDMHPPYANAARTIAVFTRA